MGFLGIYKAVYDYEPQSEGELAISEGDLLYVLEKDGDDDWWKAKKKAVGDDEDEPTGLIPNNYVDEAPVISHARALYDYSRQTDEEVSFSEDAKLEVFDTSDPDWILVGADGEYGFAPANYIDLGDGASDDQPEPEPEPEPESAAPPSLPARPPAPVEPIESRSPPLPERHQPSVSERSSPISTPAAALAGVIQGRAAPRAATPPPIAIPSRQQYLSEESDDEPSPALPARPRSQSNMSSEASPTFPPPQRTSSRRRVDYDDEVPPHTTGRIAPGGFHMYNINEMVSVMGKKKKMPTTLGVNLKTGMILIAPERSSDGPTQEWSADRMTHYSREGKHVFLELVRPSRSIDFHAGAKDTAAEIVSALGELSGAVKAEGLREVIMAGSGQSQKKGKMLYDFMAQGDDEVTVGVGDEVLILDDNKSEEWWQVRRLKNGKEGVVPSSYVEVTDVIPPSSSTSGINAGRSTVAQNRLEEERLTREAMKKEKSASERSKRENGRSEGSGGRSSSSRSKPDPSKLRIWTDRTKSFSVEAQFLGVKDGKINLHKVNGVKIAVPVAKMSTKDLEYVELITGISLDEDKPLSDVKRAQAAKGNSAKEPPAKVGASIDTSKPEYDWFQFFLSCDVAVGLCERYAQAFAKDSMDESVLPDVDASVLRNLGIREGDIIKVMRYLDKKFGREGKKRNVSFADDDDTGSAGGLFSGPGGTLKNNTRKGRPAPAVQTSDTVDAKTFATKDAGDEGSSTPSPTVSRSTKTTEKSNGGFDDDAWDVKPSKQPESHPKAASTPPASVPVPTANPVPEVKPSLQEPAKPPTQGMLDLSLLSQPLEPEKIQPPPPPPQVFQPPPQPAPLQQAATTQAQGASPGFFTALAQQQTGLQPMMTGQSTPAQPLNLGLTGSRQRPVAPQMTQGQPGLMPPPPARPLSAPQSVQPSSFAPPPLQPQMTGIAPPGQSLHDLTQQRMMQPQQQQYLTGFQPQATGQGMMGYNPGVGIQAQPTGFVQNQFMQPNMTGIQPQFSPIQSQPTGFNNFNPGPQFQQPSGINNYITPALEPQRTAMQPQQTGFGGNFSQGYNPALSPQSTQAPPMAPLIPQQTGPPPPVRFGVPDKIVPQPTGRRANLAHATPDNPFGF
ncbi:hypothetical protein BX600DRAFT_454899 [Xylariales sp. PMI_506]|nr:hypothetical protein BX600DRAFT_454899 [Xylariales sp. PMI_506]